MKGLVMKIYITAEIDDDYGCSLDYCGDIEEGMAWKSLPEPYKKRYENGKIIRKKGIMP